jgi:uncharacterized protein (DUF433 family)
MDEFKRAVQVKEHPTLEAEDITEALQYAAEAVRERMSPREA